jgi:hypothetical protein
MGKRYRKPYILLALAFALAVVAVSCSGGGGDGGGMTPATLTSSNAGASVSAVSQAIGLLDPTISSGNLVVPVSVSTEKPLNVLIDRMTALSRTLTAGPTIQATYHEGPVPCSGGGTMTMDVSWTGPDQPIDIHDIVDLHMTVTASNCVEYPNTINGTLSMTFIGPLDMPTGFKFSAPNSHFTDSTYPFDMTMSGFSVAIANLTADGGTATLNGAVTGTVDTEAINEEFKNFRIVYSEAGGQNGYSLSGSMKASCLGGWVTVSTPVTISGPVDTCPTAGRIDITSGDDTVNVVINPDSSIDVSFNTALVDTYADCNSLTGVCAAL